VSADADRDGDGRVAPTGDRRRAELEETVEHLWARLDQLRHERGSPSYRSTARRAGLSTSTVAGWFKKRSVVPEDWLEFEALVTALGAEPQAWQQQWTQARAAYDELRRRNAQQSRTPKPPVPDEPEPPIPAPPGQSPDELGAGGEDPGRGRGSSAVIRAVRTIWRRLGRSGTQRAAVAAAAAGVLVTGIVFVPRLWASPSEPAPLPLYRYQAPTPMAPTSSHPPSPARRAGAPCHR
jgi:hypothetical protein